MRLAHFTDTYLPQINGVTYTLKNWQAAFTARGHSLDIVYPESSHIPEDGEHPVPSLPFQPVEGYKVGLGCAGDITDRIGDVDLVHAHGPFTMGVLARRVARKQDVPLVATYHTPIQHYFDYLATVTPLQICMDSLYTAWERHFYRRCDAVLAPSPIAAEELERRTGVDVTMLSNGVDTTFFSPTDGFRERYGLEGDVVGFCGRLGYEKQLEDLIALSDRFDGTIVVAGDGFAKDDYLPRFEQAGIRYLGRLDRDEMPGFYTALDAFILPSIAETEGVAVLEANACGTPVVGADRMALRTTIQNGRNGERYAPGDIEALHRHVQNAIGDRELQRSARKVAAEHGVERVVERLESIYREIGV